MTEKTENKQPQGSNEQSFKLWFYLFAALSVALIVYNQGITVDSAHALIMMVFVRQMSLIYHEDVKGKALRIELDDLAVRMDKIDPYTED